MKEDWGHQGSVPKRQLNMRACIRRLRGPLIDTRVDSEELVTPVKNWGPLIDTVGELSCPEGNGGWEGPDRTSLDVCHHTYILAFSWVFLPEEKDKK